MASETTSPNPNPPTKIAICLFPGFQLLDVAGPLDALNILAMTKPLRLSILAASREPVSTAHHMSLASGTHFSQAIVPTHTYDNAPEDIEVLIIPGGVGARKEENVQPVVEYVKRVFPKLRWCLTVCTGSWILARTGILDGKRATSNKKAFGMVKEQCPKVNWIAHARWVVDGKIWTSSGISAGIDLIYAWIADVWDEETAAYLADSSEYVRDKAPDDDKFADRWGAA